MKVVHRVRFRNARLFPRHFRAHFFSHIPRRDVFRFAVFLFVFFATGFLLLVEATYRRPR